MLLDSTTSISLPQAPNHRPEFRMVMAQRKDQIATTMSAHGWSSFERPMPDVFLACAKRFPGCIIDIGANTGFYSLVGLCADERNEVIAFEPDPAVLPLLRKNVGLNGLGKRLHVEAIALSNEVGKANLYIPLQDHGLVETSSSLNAEFKGVHSKVVTVPVTTLDRYLSAPSGSWLSQLFQRRPAGPVTLIKIDVEGHEHSAMEGCLGTIEKHRPILFVEMLPRADFAYFNELKARLGYIDVRLRPNEAVVAENVAFDEHAWNHVLLPKTQRELFESMLSGLGLPMRSEGA